MIVVILRGEGCFLMAWLGPSNTWSETSGPDALWNLCVCKIPFLLKRCLFCQVHSPDPVSLFQAQVTAPCNSYKSKGAWTRWGNTCRYSALSIYPALFSEVFKTPVFCPSITEQYTVISNIFSCTISSIVKGCPAYFCSRKWTWHELWSIGNRFLKALSVSFSEMLIW